MNGVIFEDWFENHFLLHAAGKILLLDTDKLHLRTCIVFVVIVVVGGVCACVCVS